MEAEHKLQQVSVSTARRTLHKFGYKHNLVKRCAVVLRGGGGTRGVT